MTITSSARVARDQNYGGGFTLVDLLISLGIIAILAALLLPVVSRSKSRARRIQCTSNLRQVDLALLMFAGDHEGILPWALLPGDGGSADEWHQNASVHFGAISNLLLTPRLLLCPKDRSKEAANHWSELSDDNISYLVGLESNEIVPQSILSGDRFVSGSHNSVPCPALGERWNGFGFVNAPMGTTIDVNSTWTKEAHDKIGNLALTDGSVHQLDSRGLQRQSSDSDPSNNNNHARVPE